MHTVGSISIVLIYLVILFVLDKCSASAIGRLKVHNDLCSFSTDEFIRYYGYDAEIHKVTTEDGYILTVYRCNSKNASTETRKPLLIVHGFFSSSNDFTIPNNQSLAYVFANAGYDVFLTNARGNVNSRNHTTKNPDDPSDGFWKFSWDDIGYYDHPAVIDYILNITNQPKLYYIGHSQGGGSLAILLSERPEYNEKIHVASLMAPAFGLRRISYVSDAIVFFGKLVKQLYENMEFFPLSRSNKVVSGFCKIIPYACNTLLDTLMGRSENQKNDTIISIFLCHFPAGVSSNQYIHFADTIEYEYFGKYKNASDVPPDFDVSRITAPISLHLSPNDGLINLDYTMEMASKFPNVVDIQVINEPVFNHLDFALGNDAYSLVYLKILKIFKKFQ